MLTHCEGTNKIHIYSDSYFNFGSSSSSSSYHNNPPQFSPVPADPNNMTTARRALRMRASNDWPPDDEPQRTRARGRPPRPRPEPEPLRRQLPRGFVYYGLADGTCVQIPIRAGDRVWVNDHRLDVMTLETLREVCIRKTWRGRRAANHVSTYFDYGSRDFGWLPQGWIAEKRTFNPEKSYWRYYGPTGRQYTSQKKMIMAWD